MQQIIDIKNLDKYKENCRVEAKKAKGEKNEEEERKGQ